MLYFNMNVCLGQEVITVSFIFGFKKLTVYKFKSLIYTNVCVYMCVYVYEWFEKCFILTQVYLLYMYIVSCNRFNTGY